MLVWFSSIIYTCWVWSWYCEILPKSTTFLSSPHFKITLSSKLGPILELLPFSHYPLSGQMHRCFTIIQRRSGSKYSLLWQTDRTFVSRSIRRKHNPENKQQFSSCLVQSFQPLRWHWRLAMGRYAFMYLSIFYFQSRGCAQWICTLGSAKFCCNVLRRTFNGNDLSCGMCQPDSRGTSASGHDGTFRAQSKNRSSTEIGLRYRRRWPWI